MMARAREAAVAVVIPTYDHAHFLGAAIDSVLAQTIGPAEIVVVDDGSSDHPEQVTGRYFGVRIVHQTNAGLAAARNRGLRETGAPFVVFLDADDRLRSRAMETGLASLAEDETAAFTYGAYAIVDAGSGVVTDVAFRPVPKDAFAHFLRQNPIGMHGAVMYRREAIERAGGFREGVRACEDYDLYLRLARDRPVLCHSDVCADYWHHGANMSGDPAFMLRNALAVLREYRAEAGQRGLLSDYRKGIADWQRYYVNAWFGLARRAPASALPKAPSMFVQAPDAVARKLAGVLLGRSR